MIIEVIGRGVEITPAIREYAEAKAGKLLKFFDGVLQTTVTITRADHHRTAQYDVEMVLDVTGHDDFVSHAQDLDVYAAIDLASQKATRQLTDHKDKLRRR